MQQEPSLVDPEYWATGCGCTDQNPFRCAHKVHGFCSCDCHDKPENEADES
jgi:hypothetical protein